MICLDFDWQIDEFMVYCRSTQLAYQKEREKGGLLHPKKFETLCCQLIVFQKKKV